MNQTKLRAIHRILKDTHSDLGDALSPFFDDPRHGPAIVTAGRSLYDAIDELEAVIVAELAALKDSAAAARAFAALPEDEQRKRLFDAARETNAGLVRQANEKARRAFAMLDREADALLVDDTGRREADWKVKP